MANEFVSLDNREIANTPRWFAIYTDGNRKFVHNLQAWDWNDRIRHF
jgi:hypothetical protein